MPIDDRSAWLELEVKRLSNMLESYQAWIKHMRQTQPDLVISNDGNVSVKGASKDECQSQFEAQALMNAKDLSHQNIMNSCPSIPDSIRPFLGFTFNAKDGPWIQSNGYAVKRITVNGIDYPLVAPDYLLSNDIKMQDFLELQIVNLLQSL